MRTPALGDAVDSDDDNIEDLNRAIQDTCLVRRDTVEHPVCTGRIVSNRLLVYPSKEGSGFKLMQVIALQELGSAMLTKITAFQLSYPKFAELRVLKLGQRISVLKAVRQTKETVLLQTQSVVVEQDPQTGSFPKVTETHLAEIFPSQAIKLSEEVTLERVNVAANHRISFRCKDCGIERGENGQCDICGAETRVPAFSLNSLLTNGTDGRVRTWLSAAHVCQIMKWSWRTLAHKIAMENGCLDFLEEELSGKNFHVLLSYKEKKLDRESNPLINIERILHVTDEALMAEIADEEPPKKRRGKN